MAAEDNGRAVGAVLTSDELRALATMLKEGAALLGAYESDARVTALLSALRKLLDKPSGLECCYHERARIVKLLNAQQLDEMPQSPDTLDALRDAGYRAGWNDRARSLARELES